MLDSLRGFALWGVLVVNTTIIARPPDGSLGDYEAVLPTDPLVAWLVRAFVSGKFYTLFAFLFGVSLALQLARMSRRSAAPAAWLRRRLLALLGIGLAHSVFVWNGDILKLYAVLGFGLLTLRAVSPGKLLRVGLVLLALFYLAYSSVAIGIALSSSAPEGATGGGIETPAGDQAEPRSHPGASTDVFLTGSYLEVTRERLRMLFSPRQLALLLAGVLYILPMFMLGSWFASREMHRPTDSNRRDVRRALLWSGLVGLGSCAGFLCFGAVLGRGRGTMTGAAKVAFEQLTNLGLGLFYLSLFVAHSHDRPGSRLLGALAPMGRMALTNYLFHSAFVTWLMYGYGLGLMRQLSVTPLVLGASILYLAQLAMSALWLRVFRFGPAEWAWRSLTYGSFQTLRQSSLPAYSPKR